MINVGPKTWFSLATQEKAQRQAQAQARSLTIINNKEPSHLFSKFTSAFAILVRPRTSTLIA